VAVHGVTVGPCDERRRGLLPCSRDLHGPGGTHNRHQPGMESTVSLPVKVLPAFKLLNQTGEQSTSPLKGSVIGRHCVKLWTTSSLALFAELFYFANKEVQVRGQPCDPLIPERECQDQRPLCVVCTKGEVTALLLFCSAAADCTCAVLAGTLPMPLPVIERRCSCTDSRLLDLKGHLTRCLSCLRRMTPTLLRHVQTRPLTMENHAVRPYIVGICPMQQTAAPQTLNRSRPTHTLP